MSNRPVDERVFGNVQLGEHIRLRSPGGGHVFEGIVACMGLRQPNTASEAAYFTLVTPNAFERARFWSDSDYWHNHGQRFGTLQGHPSSHFFVNVGRRGQQTVVSSHQVESLGQVALDADVAKLARHYRPGSLATYRYTGESTRFIGHLMTPERMDVPRTSGSVYVVGAALRRANARHNGAPASLDLTLNRPTDKPRIAHDVRSPAPFVLGDA